MKRTLNAVEARQKFGEVLEGVHYRGDEVVIERAGKPMAALVPLHIYENYLRREERLFTLIEKVWKHNEGVDPAEIEADVAEAIAAVRRADHRASA
jgi:prevent-host-death family protein